MKRLFAAAIAVIASGSAASAVDFAKPTRVSGGGTPITVEAPGYACPSLADLDGDGVPELLVGQFNKGKIKVFKGLGNGQYGSGEWLMAGGQPAEVPGVW